MPEPLVIVGAAGQGRETALVKLLDGDSDSFIGFLDDGVSGATPEGWPILGPISAATEYRRASFIIAINDPRSRRRVATRLRELGITRWGTLVHPEVRISRSNRIGHGCSLLGGCTLTTNIRIGDHSIVNRGAQIGHDCDIGAFCSINPGACVSGTVSIGSGCELGSNCTIRQLVRIGAGATIGMGSVVLKDVSQDQVVVGNPARVLRSNLPW
jgi:sugar O-acyltransferase (sialic acid O-acetyltransferase NeuD family)